MEVDVFWMTAWSLQEQKHNSESVYYFCRVDLGKLQFLKMLSLKYDVPGSS